MDKLDTLRLLIDIAETGSFSAVARQRSISTSTVTLAVQHLETHLGTRLITRTTRKLSLTHEGELLVAGARRIHDVWDATLGDLSQEGPLQGPIRITASNDFGRNSLVAIIDAFMALHPEVKITLMLSDTVEHLLEQHIDVAIRSGPLDDSRFKARLLIQGRQRVCAAPAYWRAHGKPEHPSELARHNCLVLARQGAPISSWGFIVDGKRLTVKVDGDRSASGGDVVREWAVRGLGVMFKNEWDIRQELLDGRLEAALDDCAAGGADLYAVYPKEIPSRRSAAFIRYLAERMADLIPST